MSALGYPGMSDARATLRAFTADTLRAICRKQNSYISQEQVDEVVSRVDFCIGNALVEQIVIVANSLQPSTGITPSHMMHDAHLENSIAKESNNGDPVRLAALKLEAAKRWD